MNSDSRGSPAWNSVWPAGTFNSSTTLARATRSSSLRSSNILMLARKLGSQGIGFFSPERKRNIKERRHYSLCRLKRSAGIEQSSQANDARITRSGTPGSCFVDRSCPGERKHEIKLVTTEKANGSKIDLSELRLWRLAIICWLARVVVGRRDHGPWRRLGHGRTRRTTGASERGAFALTGSIGDRYLDRTIRAVVGLIRGIVTDHVLSAQVAYDLVGNFRQFGD